MLKETLKKSKKNYPKSIHKGNFLYTDGGVFENEPVGMAKALAGVNDSPRYYLLIKPGPRETPEDPFLNKFQNIFSNAIALLNAILQQAQFQDFIMEGIESPLFTITSEDNKLIGDVFSAFSGFLDEKFRHYDYDMGRFEARKQLLKANKDGLIKGELDEEYNRKPINFINKKRTRVIS
ncbi:hypothetical protein HRE53_30505 (plasmid) [Acaryochloris sp. 'Moss Beach']|uniref:hypothetical protein n=1 Tax=Acaryochloris sp. 'Moss Beach' TaxID=2740837 RepID=UPI001F41CEAA|nr:hypothetical protein [Acaryochloris sp. 'Moss Beach']UJB72924.1 hypothetical protein HRE53_30505 [Acaryochloris sp. 'Moss Beach']